MRSADVRFLTVTIAAEDIGHTELHIDTAAISGYPTPLEFVSFEGIIVVSPPMGARGDCTLDDIIDVADVVYLINYLYRGGPAPEPRDAGDATCDGDLNVGDVVDLINYLYKGGYPPGCP